MKYMIKDNQAGFVLKNGIFQKMILSGIYYLPKMMGYTVEIEEMTGELDYLDVPYTGLCQTVNILCSLPFVYSILRYPKLSGIKPTCIPIPHLSKRGMCRNRDKSFFRADLNRRLDRSCHNIVYSTN